MIAAGRLRRRRDRRRYESPRKVMDDWIRANAPARSFADIGCMWGASGHYSFLAEECGATTVTAFDAMDPTDEFGRERARRSSAVRFVQGDLHDPESVAEIGVHDVVFCNGVIYHSPNPFLLLQHLHELTSDLLMVGSHTIPEVPGLEQACVFYPGLSEPARLAFASAHRDRPLTGVATPFDRTPNMGYVNTWWGITPSALEAMTEHAGFEVLERLPGADGPFFTRVVARKVPGPTSVPAPSLAREHAGYR